MNLVYLSGSTIPSKQASSVHVMKICAAFAKRGLKIYLTGLEPLKNESNSKNIHSLYNVAESFSLCLFKPFFKGLLNHLLYTLWIGKLLLSIKPQLVYGRYNWGIVLSSVLRFNVIFEVHQPPLKFHQRLFFKYIVSRKNFRKLVVISSALERELKNEFRILNTKKIVVAHDSADAIDTGSKTQKIKSIKKIGYAGSFNPGKGVEFILELAKLNPTKIFHLYGGTEEDINTAKVPNNLVFHGHKDQKTLFKELSELDLLLAPYTKKVYGDSQNSDLSRWMSPLKIFEYMSLGKPMICSDLKVIREVLNDRVNAFLAEPENTSEWTNLINELSNNLTLVNGVASNAKREQLDKYTWEKRSELVLKETSFFKEG
ncbi:MAG: glycosyltransferase [Balneola sp.]